MKLSTKEITTISLLTCLLVIFSQLSFPFFLSIPFTLQTFFIFIIQNTFKQRINVITIFLYILLGVVGIPVFSGFGSGLGTILGPTGGYIWGFALSSICIGKLNDLFILQKKNRYKRIFSKIISVCISIIIIHSLGILQFSIYSRTELIKAFYGLCTFIPVDFIKGILGITISEALYSKINSY